MVFIKYEVLGFPLNFTPKSFHPSPLPLAPLFQTSLPFCFLCDSPQSPVSIPCSDSSYSCTQYFFLEWKLSCAHLFFKFLQKESNSTPPTTPISLGSMSKALLTFPASFPANPSVLCWSTQPSPEKPVTHHTAFVLLFLETFPSPLFPSHQKIYTVTSIYCTCHPAPASLSGGGSEHLDCRVHTLFPMSRAG